ncbi:hint domain-containing protein [Haematococcus lacustris]|uniref:Hint domain-containing protein n=1 Tax=Haematococcus lacustris TaxID=44745 RepID=A0A6A0AKM2_HAELA|nr:hint domain-containing protein [Haematococcus lacustris]
MNVNNVCEDNSCFSATTRVRVKVPSAGMPSGPAPPVWQDTALEDLRIGSEVECVVPVGTAGMDLSGAITNTAYQLDTCYVYSYSHAVRATITHTRLTFTRADGSIGQLSATPTHPYFLPGHSVPLTPALPASPAAAGNVTWATGHAESSCAADTEPPSNLVNVPGGWKPFADVAVGDLMMLSDASSGRLHTTTITAVETVLGYGSFSPLLQGNALIVVEGVAVYTMVLAAHYAVVGPYEVAFSQRLAAQGTSQAVDAAPYSVPGHDVLQATPVVRATIRLPANQQQQEEAQLPHLAAQTCPGQLPELTHTPAAFPSQSSLVEASTGGAMQLNMGLHQQPAAPVASLPGSLGHQPQLEPELAALLAAACLAACTGEHWPAGPGPRANGPRRPAVRKLLGGCVQLGSRLSDLPFVSSLVDMFIALLEQGGMAGLAALADQQQAGMQFASILDVVGAFA